MACLNFQNTYFRKHLLMAAFIRFRSNFFSEHLKVDAVFIEQPSYFLLGIFLLKNHPENTYLHSHFHEKREFHHWFSSCFRRYFLRRHSSKTFLYWRNKNFDFFKAILSTLNIIYIGLIYIKKLIWVYIRIIKLHYSKQKLFFAELSTQAKHLRVWTLHED